MKIWKTLLLSVAVLASNWAMSAPKDDTSLTRKEEKSFTVGQSVLVDIQNKYGEVIIHTWNDAKVKVEVSITANGKDKNTAERLLDRVEMDWTQKGEELHIYTLFDQNTSPIKELWKTVTDQATALLSKSKIEVDYNIYLPKSAQLIIDNKYGDVYLADVTGAVKVDLSHGTLQANDLTNQTELILNFATATIQSMNEASVEIKGGTLDIDKVKMLELNSAVSEINIDQVETLSLNSRSDRVSIEEVGTMNGKCIFSKVNTSSLSQGVSLDLKYGKFDVERVKAGFSNIDIKSSSTDILLTVEEAAAFDLDVTALQEKLQLPSSNSTTMSNNIDGKYTTQKLSFGKAGTKASSKVSIDANGGEVDIRYVK